MGLPEISISLISKLEAVQCRAARWVKLDYRQTSSVTDMMQSLHYQQRIDKTLSLMYKINHNLIAIPISDFIIPPLVLQAVNCYNWVSQIFILSKSCVPLEHPLFELWPVPPWSSSIKQSARLITSHLRKSPYLAYAWFRKLFIWFCRIRHRFDVITKWRTSHFLKRKI